MAETSDETGTQVVSGMLISEREDNDKSSTDSDENPSTRGYSLGTDIINCTGSVNNDHPKTYKRRRPNSRSLQASDEI
jgi:hypothetical protein